MIRKNKKPKRKSVSRDHEREKHFLYNSCGMPRKFQMPVSRLRFRVSTCYFRRPDATRDHALTIEIDSPEG